MGVYVIGMHRSGTSALAGATSALFGLPASRSAVPSNPAGQWERLELRPALELILAWNRSTWASPQPEGHRYRIPPGLRHLAARSFSRHCADPFLWKDPRLCLTIDHWLGLSQEPPRIVFIHRDPLEVARSLQVRNGFSLDRGLALWERTNRNAIHRLGGCEVFVVPFVTLVTNPAEVIEELVPWVGLAPDPGGLASAIGSIEAGPRSRTSCRSEAATTAPGTGVELSKAQRALADRLPGTLGPARLDLAGVGPESATTAELLGAPSVGELGRRTRRALCMVRNQPEPEVARWPA